MNDKNLESMLENGKRNTISTLWCFAGEGPGLVTFAPEDRTELATRLRRLADALEQNPSSVCTLVLMAGVRATDDEGDKGVQSMHVVAGNQAGIAACHLQFDEEGESAFKQCVPFLLKEAAERLGGYPDEESALEQNQG